MERDIFLACVLTPAIISLAFALVIRLTRRITRATVRERTASVLATTGWCAAVSSTLLLRQDIDFAAPEAWQQIIVPITVIAAVLVLMTISTTTLASEWVRDIRWVVAGIGCVVVAMMVMPAGDGWVDMLPEHRGWIASVTAASLLNLWSLDRLARSGATTWVLLVVLAGLAAPTMLAASAYAGLAEWCLGAIIATMVFALFAIMDRRSMAWCSLVPAVLFATSATASGRFYTYEVHPRGLYAILLLAPTLIALPDFMLRNRSTWVRVACAATIAMSVLGVVAWLLLGDALFANPDEESW